MKPRRSSPGLGLLKAPYVGYQYIKAVPCVSRSVKSPVYRVLFHQVPFPVSIRLLRAPYIKYQHPVYRVSIPRILGATALYYISGINTPYIGYQYPSISGISTPYIGYQYPVFWVLLPCTTYRVSVSPYTGYQYNTTKIGWIGPIDKFKCQNFQNFDPAQVNSVAEET